MPEIVILNPLKAGLAHYESALRSVLERGGADVLSAGCVEPSQANVSPARWLATYVQAARSGRRASTALHLAIWPAVGYWDMALLPIALRRRMAFVLHDPHPLVRALGYGSAARTAALLGSRYIETVVHSRAAATAASEAGGPRRLTVLPHPTHTPTTSLVPQPSPTVVRVLGQFKADRDVAALSRVGAKAPPHWKLEIIGRGWPEIPGWTVNDSFVSEEQFTRAIRSSSVVLIPYTRFFQSGVAIRCLENGVPLVGPANSSLGDLLGADSRWLVKSDDWLPSIHAAIESSAAVVAQRRAIAVDHEAVTAWSRWLQARGAYGT